MIGIDTHVLVRYVSDDDADQSPRVAAFFEQELSEQRRGYISLVALAELAWVLRARHQASTAEVAVVVEELNSDPRFCLQDEQSVWLALEMVDNGAEDFPDALISAVGIHAGCSYTTTFDKHAAKSTRMRLLQA